MACELYTSIKLLPKQNIKRKKHLFLKGDDTLDERNDSFRVDSPYQYCTWTYFLLPGKPKSL